MGRKGGHTWGNKTVAAVAGRGGEDELWNSQTAAKKIDLLLSGQGRLPKLVVRCRAGPTGFGPTRRRRRILHFVISTSQSRNINQSRQNPSSNDPNPRRTPLRRKLSLSILPNRRTTPALGETRPPREDHSYPEYPLPLRPRRCPPPPVHQIGPCLPGHPTHDNRPCPRDPAKPQGESRGDEAHRDDVSWCIFTHSCAGRHEGNRMDGF